MKEKAVAAKPHFMFPPQPAFSRSELSANFFVCEKNIFKQKTNIANIVSDRILNDKKLSKI
jgi:hypothetical protein